MEDKDEKTENKQNEEEARPEQGIPVGSLSFLSNIQPDFWDSFD